MAKRNSSGSSSGRRGASRTSRGERPSSGGARKSGAKPFKRSDSKSSGRTSSFGKEDRGSSFKKGAGSGEARSSGSRFGKKTSEGPHSSGSRTGKFSKSYDKGDKGDSSFRPGRREDSSGSRFGKRTSDGPRSSGSRGGKFSKSYDKGDKGDSSFRPGRREDSSGSRFGKRTSEGPRSSGSRGGKFSKSYDKGDKGDSSFRPGRREDSAGSRFGKRTSEGPRSSGSRGGKFSKPFDKGDKGDSSSRPDRKEDSSEGRFRKKTSEEPRSSGRPRKFSKPYDKEEPKEFVNKSKTRYAEKSGGRRSKEEVSEPAQTSQIRLNRYIANSGICSRREADELIAMGLVSVNGKTITEMGFKVNPGDTVKYESKVLTAEKPVYVLMNKPKGYLTTTDDPQERQTVMHILAGSVKERIYPVGRLDRNTTGLLLLTNDGDLADKLMHPSYNVKKIYKVELDRPLTKADFQTIRDGVMLEEGRAVIDDLAIVSDDGKTVGVELHIGWNRVVRRIFESLTYAVVKLDRSVYAGLDKKDLSRGHWRFLKKEEIIRLKHYK